MTETMDGSATGALAGPKPWDYRVVSVHARHNDVLERELQALGRDGWQLVFMSMPMANEFQCVLVRPLN